MSPHLNVPSVVSRVLTLIRGFSGSRLVRVGSVPFPGDLALSLPVCLAVLALIPM